ncbi:unnamed protein product, partial [Effrenium voratum]
ETARLTTASMPPDHPLASLVRQNLGAKSDPRSTKRALREVTKKTVSNMPLTPPATAGEERKEKPPSKESVPETPPNSRKRLEDSLSKKRGPEDKDVFKQYLRDREMARVAHLLALS